MLWAVIMAGGSGTRFWPESRIRKPKQFLKIFGSKTLFEETLERIKPLIPAERVLVVTQSFNTSLVKKLAPEIPASQIIGEPVGRNTAPCAALAAAIALKKDPKAVLAILPSDHLIQKPAVFRKALSAAAWTAFETEMPVTFGIRPAHPHTGFGYLEVAQRIRKEGSFSFHRLKRFCEKPDLKTAKKFIQAKRFLWNAGIFIWRAEALQDAVRSLQPEIDRYVALILRAPSFQKAMKQFFPKMPSISIDYGLMEALRGKILTAPVDFGWNDLGGWQVLPEMWPADPQGNVTRGNVILIDSCHNIVKAGEKLVVLLGVGNCAVIDTPDALLICAKDKTESIKQVTDHLRIRKKESYL